MEEKNNYQLTPEKQKQARSEAEKLLKEGKDAIREKLPKCFEATLVYGIEVTKDIVEIHKESIESKNGNQKDFIQICDKIIDTCNVILSDGKITESEKKQLLKMVDYVFKAAEKSNEQIQKDSLEIAKQNKETAKYAIKAGFTAITILGTVAMVLTSVFKKR